MTLKASAPLLPSNPDRLAALRRYGVLKHEAQASYARAATLAARAVGAPVSLVLLVAETSLRVAASSGVDLANATRKLPFRLEGVLHDRFLQTSDTSRVQIMNDLIDPQSPAQYAFHAAVPLRTTDGQVLGSLCVLDHRARTLGPNQALLLEGIADHLVCELNLRLELWRASQVTTERAEANRQPILERIIESSNLAVLSTTLEGIITTWNAAAERTFGYSTREVLGRNIDFLVPKQSRENERIILERLTGGERLETLEVLRLHKDGRELRIRLNLSPITGAGGRMIGMSHVCDDVSNETQARARTSMIREKLDRLAQELPSIRFAVDHEGVITLAEGKGLDMIGATTHLLLGQSIFELYARYPQIAEIARRGLGGETFTSTIETSNHRVMLAVAPLEHILSAEHEIIGATGLAIMIPGVPKRGENLPLLQALEALPDAIMLTTANFGTNQPEIDQRGTDQHATGPEVLFVNQAFEQLSGLDATTLTSLPENPLTDLSVLENAMAALKTDPSYLEEIVTYNPDGTCLSVQWQVFPITDANGTITHLINLQREIKQPVLPEAQAAPLALQSDLQSDPANQTETDLALALHDPDNAFAKLDDEELSSYLAHLTSLRGLVPNSSTMLLPDQDPAELEMRNHFEAIHHTGNQTGNQTDQKNTLEPYEAVEPTTKLEPASTNTDAENTKLDTKPDTNPDDELKDGLKVGLQGQLEEVGGAGTLLQMISMIVQSGALHLEDTNGQHMRLYLHTGRITHIEHPTLKGLEAVMKTLALEQGRFRFMTGQIAPEQSMSLDPVTIALEVAKHHDETGNTANETIKSEPDAGLVVLPNIRVALEFLNGIGGTEHFSANLEHDPRWGDHVTLRGRGVRIVVLQGSLEDLPVGMIQKLQTTR
jgi:PAS domain S-box-containing protein